MHNLCQQNQLPSGPPTMPQFHNFVEAVAGVLAHNHTQQNKKLTELHVNLEKSVSVINVTKNAL